MKDSVNISVWQVMTVFLKVLPLRRLRFVLLLVAAAVMCALGLIMTLSVCTVNNSEGESGTVQDDCREDSSFCSGDVQGTGRAEDDMGKESADKKAAPVRLCVIMYHGLVKDSAKQNRYMIDPHFFEDDLRFLTENGYSTIVTKDLTDHFLSGKALPAKPVMLTFDDGYYNNYLYAFPPLKKYGCRAVLSPIGRACEKAENEERQDEFYSQCTIAQLREMCESGLVELAYHTYDLHSIGSGVQGVQQRPDETDAAYKTRLIQDIDSFAKLMQPAANEELNCFTYPFGAKSKLTGEILKSEGFQCALDCEEKINVLSSPQDLYSIHRFLRDGVTPSDEFFNRIENMRSGG